MSKRKLSPGEHFVAGTIAGLSSTVALFPLDTIKVRFQVNEKTTLAAPQRLKSAFEKVIKEEGWRGLYQGLQAGMLGSGLSWGGYFYFYEHAKQRWVTSDGGKQPGALAWMAASAEAGTIMVALTNPIWLVKTRLQLQLRQIAKQSTTASTAAPTTAPLVDPSLSGTVRRQPYKGFFDAISTIVREEGILALYKGSIPALMLVSHGAAQFVVYEAMKSEYAKRYDQKTPGTFTVLSMGAAAKIFASIATYPFQVIKTRLQQRKPESSDRPHDASSSSGKAGEVPKKQPKWTGSVRMLAVGTRAQYKGVVDCVVQTWRHEGVYGFYKGCLPNAVRVAPGAAVTFFCYETVADLLRKRPSANSDLVK